MAREEIERAHGAMEEEFDNMTASKLVKSEQIMRADFEDFENKVKIE